jgi:hypothetical protein
MGCVHNKYLLAILIRYRAQIEMCQKVNQLWIYTAHFIDFFSQIFICILLDFKPLFIIHQLVVEWSHEFRDLQCE